MALRLERTAWLAVPVDDFGRLALAIAGVVPITLIVVIACGISDLRQLSIFVLGPVLLATLLSGGRDRAHWRMVVSALGAGIVATAVYDLYRFGFLWLGLVPVDPIPRLGTDLDLHPAWVFGYLWRYVGDGGGLALAFYAFGMRGVRVGVAFGLVVCGGLVAMLALTPLGQEILFPLSWTTLVMATGGHAIYGAVLGAFAARSTPRPV